MGIKHGHAFIMGFLAVVVAKVARGLLSGWLNINF